MATNENWWRHTKTSNYIFVDWDLGCDYKGGDGTAEHPFGTISHGVSKRTAAGQLTAGAIVRGHGNEAYVGNHSFVIEGDYLGAAILDCGGTSLITYCTMKNMIMMNAGTTVDVDYGV